MSSPWSSFLYFKYGYIKGHLLDASWSINNRKASLWWKDLRASLATWGHDPIWFGNLISCKLVSYSNINLWNSRWVGSQPLKVLFHIVFNFDENSRLKVDHAGLWRNVSWCLNLGILYCTLNMEILRAAFLMPLGQSTIEKPIYGGETLGLHWLLGGMI